MARYVSTPQVISGYANRCVYSTPGSYTFTVPDGVTSIKTLVVGGGGNGSTGFVNDYSELKKPFKLFNSNQNLNNCLGVGCWNYVQCRCYIKGTICSDIVVNMDICTEWPSIETYSYAYTGAGGGYSEKTIAVTPGDTFNVTVGDIEETSSFFGTPGCLSATGASAPAECRQVSPGGYWDCIEDFQWSVVQNCAAVCSDAEAQTNGRNNSYAQIFWALDKSSTNDTFYWKEVFGCPLKCLVSSPGCGIGGDVNYVGGPSGQFNVKSNETCNINYGTGPFEINCCSFSCIRHQISARNYGMCNGAFCSASGWTCWYNIFEAAGGDTPHMPSVCCYFQTSAETCGLIKSAGCFGFLTCVIDNYTQHYVCQTSCINKRSDPVFKSYSSDRNFLNANKGGSSAGSPLGPGQQGGTGQTVFGSEVDSYICSAIGICTQSCCGQDLYCWYCPNPHFTCIECGYSNITTLHCCHEKLLFHRYMDMYETPTAGCNEACKVYFSAAFNEVLNDGWFYGDNNIAVPKNAQCHCNRRRLDPTCGPCLGCLQYACKDFGLQVCTCCNQCTGRIIFCQEVMTKHTACDARYSCCPVQGCWAVWTGCTTCMDAHNNCFGVCTDMSLYCNCSVLKEGLTIEDLIDSQWHPLARNWWYCHKAYATNPDFVDDCMCLAWKITCRQFNHNMYYTSVPNGMCAYVCGGQCNCGTTKEFGYRPSYKDHCAVGQYTCNTFCNGYVGTPPFCSPTKILNTITAADAFIIPGSAGGPNAEGNPGVILGNQDIYIAGTGADPYGKTEAQFIETSSGGGMPTATYQDIRLRYSGDTWAWYLCECWAKECPKFATGGTDFCNTCVLPLTDVLTKSKCCQQTIFCSHTICSTGGCFGSNNTDFCEYAVKMFNCYYAYAINNWGYSGVLGEYGGQTTVCPCQSMTIGSSGGIIISSKSKNFDGTPLCINTGGGGSSTSVVVQDSNYSMCTKSNDCSCNKWMDCVQNSVADWAFACIGDNITCRYQVTHNNPTCNRLHGKQLGSESCSIKDNPALEHNKVSSGGGSEVFVNEQYNGGPLKDEYLFTSDDAVFGGTGQICIYGSTLYSLPGLTQGGSVGGCVVKGNCCQVVTQTPYSGGIFPKGKPGYGGGGTVCGAGGSGLVVVYWN